MKISIIVCTRNRSYAITTCLDSIAESLAAASPVEAEIVVVDNASTDDTSAIVQKWAETCKFPIRLLHEPKKGLSAARNCALRAAKGDLLAFTDDDCCLSKDYVTKALQYDAADTGPVFRGGRVELGDPTDLPVTIKTDPHVIRMSLKMNSARHEDAGIVIGCNMVLRRTLADTIGFFDENLGAGTDIPSAEDTDYLYRGYLSGAVLEYVPDMTIYHFHGRKTVAEINKLLRNYMLGLGALYMKYLFKHINFCRPFYWDLKNAVKEIATGEIGCRPEFGFSYKIKVWYCILGVFKYCFVVTKSLCHIERDT